MVVAFLFALCVFTAVAAEPTLLRGPSDSVRPQAAGLTVVPYPTTPADKASWTYDDTKTGLNGVCSVTNKCGPSSWKNIQAVAPTVNACNGQSQTPINIEALDVVTDPTLTFPTFSVMGGGCSSWTQFADDHVFEFSVSDKNTTCTNFKVTYGGTTYTLLQGHTHAPSEHQFGGSYFDAELHMVHKSSDGKLLVVGVNFLSTGNGVSPSGGSQSTFTNMWTAAAAAYKSAGGSATAPVGTAQLYKWEVAVPTPINFYTGFLPPSRVYYTYTGSLTTYPCTEGVTWVVFDEPVRISQIDLAILRGAVKANPNTIVDPATGNDNRPVQPLNGRIVRRYAGIDPPTSSPSASPTVAFGTYVNRTALANVLSSSGAAVTTALTTALGAAAYPGIVVSNAVTTVTATGVSATQNIPAGVTLSQAAVDPFKSAYIAAVASVAGVSTSFITGYTATAGRRLLAGVNVAYTVNTVASAAPTLAPTSKPASTPAAGMASCFAATEQVTLENGATKAISEVVVGDRILTVNAKTGEQVYSDVAYVPHGKNMDKAVFTVLTTEAGRDVKMTANHVLPAGACDLATASLPYVSASSVVAGDCVETVAGRERVVSVSTVEGRGIYTVIAMEELLVVNGVVATPYGGINPALANVYYNLHRLAYQVYGAGAMKQWVQAATEMLWGSMSL